MTFKTDYDGRSIMENVEYVSAVVLKRENGVTTTLVKLQDDTNLLITMDCIHFAGQDVPTKTYDVHSGSNVDKFAEEYSKHSCVAHNLLLEMKA